jgi:single-stranded DNA-binding protein
MLNVAVIEGRLARPAELRTLPSGSQLVSLEVTVRPDVGPAETTPVACFDAPAWVADLDADAPVVVVGRVRRRFFRADGTTQSRTEVVAEHVLRPTTVARTRRALTGAMAAIEVAAAGLGRDR